MKSLLASNPQVQIGSKHGRLTVMGAAFHIRVGAQRRKCAVCECRCGAVLMVWVSSLLTGNTQSCGCRKIDIARARMTTHGCAPKGKYPPLYQLWGNMKKRCTRPIGVDCERYAKRGISVCEEWENDFAAFRDWAESHGYEHGLQIDRKDNDGNYEPDNCRFVTPQVNSNNRSSNHFIAAFGETKTLAEWSRDPRCVVTYDCLKRRSRKGWPAEAALTYVVSPGVRPVFQ